MSKSNLIIFKLRSPLGFMVFEENCIVGAEAVDDCLRPKGPRPHLGTADHAWEPSTAPSHFDWRQTTSGSEAR